MVAQCYDALKERNPERHREINKEIESKKVISQKVVATVECLALSRDITRFRAE